MLVWSDILLSKIALHLALNMNCLPRFICQTSFLLSLLLLSVLLVVVRINRSAQLAGYLSVGKYSKPTPSTYRFYTGYSPTTFRLYSGYSPIRYRCYPGYTTTTYKSYSGYTQRTGKEQLATQFKIVSIGSVAYLQGSLIYT